MNQRVLALGLAIAAAFAAMLIVAGCSAPMTLEKYFSDHPDEWTAVEDQIKNMGGEMFSLDLTVKDNQINQVMTYTEKFTDDAVKEMKTYFESQKSALVSQLQNSIKSVESGAGVDGITWYVQYNNGDGTEIFSTTVDKNTKVEAPAAASTATDTSGAGA